MTAHLEESTKEKLIAAIGQVEDISTLDSNDVIKLYGQYLNPIAAHMMRFIGTKLRFVSANGMHLIDENGKVYLDFYAAFGALNLGHEPQPVLNALHGIAHKPNLLQAAPNPYAAKLGEALAILCPGNLTRSFLCNSGTEAVEAAIKLARAATCRKLLVYTEGAYHGKTMGALSVSGRAKYKLPFEPLLPHTKMIPYNDLTALQEVLRTESAAAFIVEPIQGENGVVMPDPQYLTQAKEICQRYGTLLIADEVQTGMGRTGRLLACNHSDVVPHVVTLSKSLGGGVMPIGAMVTTDKIWKQAYGKIDRALLHTSTFGGNSRACAAALAAIKMLVTEELPENAQTIGNYLLTELKKLSQNYPILKQVRGQGLMIGLNFIRLRGKPSLMDGAVPLWVTRRLLKKARILSFLTLNNQNTLRIAPPLIINMEQAQFFIANFEEALAAAQSFKLFQLLKDQ